MRTRKEVIEFCMSLKQVYEDYPFQDSNWTLMRHETNKKTFAFIFERDGHIWVNIKCDPEWILVWRETYDSVVPAFHMNKKYWNSIILDGSVPDEDIKRMIGESYDLIQAGIRRQK